MIYDFFENLFIQFPFQLLISESIFLINTPKRKHFLTRLMIGLIVQILLGTLWESIHILAIPQPLVQHTMLYLGYAFLTVIPILGSFEIEIQELIFILAGRWWYIF